MKKIQLTQGKYALIDDYDFELIAKYKWCYNAKYAVALVNKKRVYMHRFLMNPPVNMFIDHINMNRLDNRRSNLRVCTNSQNQQNRNIKSNNISGYKGVVWHKIARKWQAQIKFDNKLHYLGVFAEKENAIKAYKLKSRELFKEFSAV